MTTAPSTTTVQPFTAQNVQSWEVWHPRVNRERFQVVALIQESTPLIHNLAVYVQSYLYFPTCILSLSENPYSERPIPFSVQELHPVDFNCLTLPSRGLHSQQISNGLVVEHNFSSSEKNLAVSAFERQGLTVSTYFTLPVEERQKRTRKERQKRTGEQYGVQLTNAEQITEAVTVRVIIPPPSSPRAMFLNLVFSPKHQERGVLTQLQQAENPGDFHNPGLLRPRNSGSSLPRVSSSLCAYGTSFPGRNLDEVPNMIFGQSRAGVLSVEISTNANQLFHVVPFSPSSSSCSYRHGKIRTRLFSAEAATADAMRIEICLGSTSPSLSSSPAAPVKAEQKGSGGRTYRQDGKLLMIHS